MRTIYDKNKPHPKGRYTLNWKTGRMITYPGMRNGQEQKIPETAVATYEITGKTNPVYVALTTLPSGKWFDRETFDVFYTEAIEKLDGEVIKPVSKNWKRMVKHPLQGVMGQI